MHVCQFRSLFLLFVILFVSLFVCLFVCLFVWLSYYYCFCFIYLFFYLLAIFRFLWVNFFYYYLLFFFSQTDISAYNLVLFIFCIVIYSFTCTHIYNYVYISTPCVQRICNTFLRFDLLLFYLNVDHDVNNAALSLCLFLYICTSLCA